MTAADVLDAMIARLQDKGWLQGQTWEDAWIMLGGRLELSPEPGRACLGGTAELCMFNGVSKLAWNAGELLLSSRVADLLNAAIGELFPGRTGALAHWSGVVTFNDHPDTTFEDVLLVCKHAREMQ